MTLMSLAPANYLDLAPPHPISCPQYLRHKQLLQQKHEKQVQEHIQVSSALACCPTPTLSVVPFPVHSQVLLMDHKTTSLFCLSSNIRHPILFQLCPVVLYVHDTQYDIVPFSIEGLTSSDSVACFSARPPPPPSNLTRLPIVPHSRPTML